MERHESKGLFTTKERKEQIVRKTFDQLRLRGIWLWGLKLGALMGFLGFVGRGSVDWIKR
jgi:hypothetical protein